MSFDRLAFVLTILANWVGNFKRINMELQTSKLHKVGFKWNVNFRWSQVTIKSELLDEASKMGNSVSYNWNTIVQESTFFSHVHTQRLLNEFFFQGFTTFTSRLKCRKWIQSLPKLYQNPINTPLRRELKKEKEIRKKKGRKIFIKKPNLKVQEPNMKDFLSFERIVGWWEAKLSKEK